MNIKIIQLNNDNYKDYPKQICEMSEEIKKYNSNHDKEGQFFGTSEQNIINYIKSKDAEVFVAINEDDRVVGYNFVNLNVKQNTNSDYTKYFHASIDYKNNLANNFSDIEDYNRYVTEEYLRKIIIFEKVTSEITNNPEQNPNGYDIATFIKKQVEMQTFYENNFLRRVVNLEMYKKYESLEKVTEFAQIYFYSIIDVDRKILEELYQKINIDIPLDTLITNYELFLKYQQPNFIEKEKFNLEEYFDVEMKNSLEINTYAVNPEYRSQGLPKILLYESLKCTFYHYFQKEDNSVIYLVSTVHNANQNSQSILNSFGLNQYLYVERMKNLNRRVYIHKISKEEFLDFLYNIAVELLINYNYYSENFGIDMIDMKDKIENKIKIYQQKIILSDDKSQKAYYQEKIDGLNELLKYKIFTEKKGR